MFPWEFACQQPALLLTSFRDSRCSTLCLAHGRIEDPSNLVFKLIMALF